MCVCVGGGGMISDFKKNTDFFFLTNSRERSDQARGSEATERGEGTVGTFFSIFGIRIM